MVLDLILPPPAKSRAVEAEMLFLQSAAGRPAVSFQRVPTGEYSATYASRRVHIGDARQLAPRLDIEGFALVKHGSAVADFWNEDEVNDLGRAEAAEIVAHHTGAHAVFVFDHTLRRRAPNSARQPSTRVHIDYTPDSARQRVRDLLGDDEAAQRPFAFINVWRPIRHPALDWPLALADARSVAPGDLIATDIEYADRIGEIFHVRHNPAQRWYAVPAMQLDEALLIKCADTRPGLAQGSPHTAFAHPNTPLDAPPRESIEFRTIAFFDAPRRARFRPAQIALYSTLFGLARTMAITCGDRRIGPGCDARRLHQFRFHWTDAGPK